ncbi:MAG: ABC transporter ATP-binding protein [Lachnospiraceae bacterium]|nr:ABC transporter ATP-binding protein [Lachnospiraceae bacterium]
MITVEHLTKMYGNFTAVSDLSFEINEGHVYGFLGPNGAGKTTTMNIMTGCLSATDGTVKIDGHDIFEEPDQAKRLIGYLPEQPPLYLNETPWEYLTFVGEAKGLRGAELKKQIEEGMEQTKITEMRNRRISALSKGYKQRVGIAQALLGSPKVIILDEPTVGLDPIQIIEIRDMIKELGQHHTVILSSHILSEVQAICDEIMIISHGKLVAFGEPEKLTSQLLSPNEITITADADEMRVREILKDVHHITDLTFDKKESDYTTVRMKTNADNIYETSRAIFSAFARNDAVLLELALKQANLEDVFLELTEGADAAKSAKDSTDLKEKKAGKERNAARREIALKTAEAALAEEDEAVKSGSAAAETKTADEAGEATQADLEESEATK